jgi:hypothetical protein
MRAHAWGADVVPPSGHHPLCALIGIFGHQGGMARLWVIEYGASAWRGHCCSGATQCATWNM